MNRWLELESYNYSGGQTEDGLFCHQALREVHVVFHAREVVDVDAHLQVNRHTLDHTPQRVYPLGYEGGKGGGFCVYY